MIVRLLTAKCSTVERYMQTKRSYGLETVEKSLQSSISVNGIESEDYTSMTSHIIN